jgi:glucose-1-phosphate thymidylyltransferase
MRKDEVIGLIPCAGHATRITPLPCSKELLPVGLGQTPDGFLRPKVVSHYLLEKMRRGGVSKAYFILRKGKWDIPQYYGDGAGVGMNLGYLITDKTYGPPYTLDEAYPFVRNARVALGFPDILIEPDNAYARTLERLTLTGADVALSLYKPHKIQVSDMIAIDRTGRVRELVIKPNETNLTWGWIFAVWTPRFTEFMHEYLTTPRTAAEQPGSGLPPELTVGHVIQAAISEGLPIQSVIFRGKSYLDIGSPEGLHEVAHGYGRRLVTQNER